MKTGPLILLIKIRFHTFDILEHLICLGPCTDVIKLIEMHYFYGNAIALYTEPKDMQRENILFWWMHYVYLFNFGQIKGIKV